METVEASDATTDFPRLLERVAAREGFTITRLGKPVARLLPIAPSQPKPDVRQAIEDLKLFSKGCTLGGVSTIRAMIDDGRRF